jgi:hypothetical protein
VERVAGVLKSKTVMSFTDHPQLVWLVLLCSPPLALALLLAAWRQRTTDAGDIRLGNPLFRPGAVPPQSPRAELRPLLKLTRMHRDSDLRALVIGLRHLPLRDSSFLLRRYQKSSDPELQLYAQSILQQRQEDLQQVLAQFLPLATEQSPAFLASSIEACLQILASPATSEPERDALLRKLAPKARLVCESRMTHPRAAFNAARFYLADGELDRAEELAARLPAESPLRHALDAQLRHHAAVQSPPPRESPRYTIR